jgi:hypothetical protein
MGFILYIVYEKKTIFYTFGVPVETVERGSDKVSLRVLDEERYRVKPLIRPFCFVYLSCLQSHSGRDVLCSESINPYTLSTSHPISRFRDKPDHDSSLSLAFHLVNGRGER